MSVKTKISRLCLILVLIVTNLQKQVDATSGIKTVVVVVMQNRSFDHMVGWMKKLNPEINGVNGSESNPVSVSDPSSKKFYFGSGSHYVDPDPGHSFQEIREQVFGSNETSMDPPPMNGFVQQAYSIDPSGNLSSSVMNGFLPDKVPVYKSLVSHFALFDRWFASVPSSTQPNRMFVHSGTSGGATSNNAFSLILGYPQRTIFDNLDKDNISFGIYYQNIPAVLVYRSLRKLKYIPNFHNYEDSFKDHAMQAKLPPYTVIEQRFVDSKSQPATDDHPSHDVFQGQKFIKEVYETLRASPQWNETLLIITYDEHGGYFDHVPTPVRNVPSPDGLAGQEPYRFEFNRLGIRVPTIAVSPWIEKGTVVHGPNGFPYPSSEYEHSSIPATVKKLFNLSSPFLTKRDEWAGTFENILQTRKEPRTDCPEMLPEPVRIRMTEANENAPLSEFQKELVQLAAVLNGDYMLTSFPNDINKGMTVIEAKRYMEDAVKRFLEAGRAALAMGANKEEFVHMKPSLTERNLNP